MTVIRLGLQRARRRKIERAINRLKRHRAVATLIGELSARFEATVPVAAIGEGP
ncbi:hypothetical protein [Streptomyces sp. NPDC059651]|uniref:hypothetical protein n=1 Tax=unclassified Streptomyces TaxID=2593676 RepID=UPI0036CECC28